MSKSIPQLTAVTTFADADLYHVNRSNVDYKITGANLKTAILGLSAGGQLSGTLGNATLLNSAVIGKVLTGYTSGAGTVASTDTILQAIQKLNGNVDAIPPSWRLNGNTLGNDTTWIGSINDHDFLVKTNNTTVASFLKDGSIAFGASTYFQEQSSTVADWYINGTSVIQTKEVAAGIAGVGIGIDVDTAAAGGLTIGGRTHLRPASSPYTDTVALVNYSTRVTSTENAWMKVDGSVGLGFVVSGAASVKLQVRSTGEQIRASYDASNYFKTTVGSTGGVVFDGAGSGSSFIFKKPAGFGAALSSLSATVHIKGDATDASGTIFNVNSDLYSEIFNVTYGKVITAKGTTIIKDGVGSPLGDATFEVANDGPSYIARFGCATTPTALAIGFQGRIGIGVLAAHATALVDMTSSNKGFLPPRMTTTDKNNISSPAEGLIVYDSTLHKLCIYTGSAWETITSV